MAKVYVSHVTPVMSEKEVVRYVSEADLELAVEYFRKLIEVLNRVLRRLTAGGVTREETPKVLRLVADYIVAYIKLSFVTPLALPATGSDRELWVPLPQELYLLLRIAKSYADVRGDVPAEVLESITKSCILDLKLDVLREFLRSSLDRELIEALREVESPSRAMELIKVLVEVPADSRPGANVSKLIPHMLMTSAIASATYLKRCAESSSCSELELEVLRVASLLHDVGKPIAWLEGTSHVRASEQIISKLFEGVNLPEEIIRAIRELVYHHHDPERVSIPAGARVRGRYLAHIVREADRIASAADRLSDVVAEVLAGELGTSKSKLREYLIVSTDEARRFWEGLGEEKLKELSERVAKELPSRVRSLKADSSSIPHLMLLTADVRRIQEFIRREKLGAIIASSYLIDLVTAYVIPNALSDVMGIPPECIILSSGGEVKAIAPNLNINEYLSRAREYLRRQLCGVDIQVTLTYSEFFTDWRTTMNHAVARVSAEKLVVNSNAEGNRTLSLPLGYEVPCEFCGRKVAKVKYHESYLCEECRKIIEFSENFHVTHKLQQLRDAGIQVGDLLHKDRADSNLMKFLMEWLSGSPMWREGESLSISVVKADGNKVGKLMASAVNVSHAMELSARIDLGLKAGISEVLRKLRGLSEKEGDGLLARAYVGFMYAGGDDLLAVWPAWLSIPAAVTISYWFWRLLGGETQLSVGIAAGKQKHNIWALIDIADYLVKLSKELARSSKEREVFAYIAYEHSIQQLIPASTEEFLGRYRTEGISRQPYRIHVEYRPGGFRDLMASATALPEEALKGGAEDFLKALWDYLKDENLSKLREASRYLIEVVRGLMGEFHKMRLSTAEDLRSLALTYLARQHARVGEEIRKAVLKKVAVLAIDAPPPLYDLLLLGRLMRERGEGV